MESLKQILDNLRSQWPEPTPPLNCVAMPVDEVERNELKRSQARCFEAEWYRSSRSITDNEARLIRDHMLQLAKKTELSFNYSEELKELAQDAAIQVQGRSLIPLDAQIRAGTDFCCNNSIGEEETISDVSSSPMAVVKGRGDLL